MGKRGRRGEMGESSLGGIVNRERRKWKGINEDIKIEEWENHFKRLLGGVEGRVVQGTDRKGSREWEAELGRVEIGKILARVRDGKAVGVDRISRKAWKYGGEKRSEYGRCAIGYEGERDGRGNGTREY